jgi:hypothetical protein
VHDEAGLVLLRLYVPELLQAEAVHLRGPSELEFLFQLSSKLSAAAFGEEGVLAVQLHAGLVGGGLFAVLADSHVAGRDTLDLVSFVKDLRGSEAREDLDAGRFSLLAEPARDVRQADDVHAVVLKALGE